MDRSVYSLAPSSPLCFSFSSLLTCRHWSEFIVEEGLGDFPVGWEQRFTSSGVPYFVDHINRTTTVQSPSCWRLHVLVAVAMTSVSASVLTLWLQFQDPRLQVQKQRRQEALHHEAKLPQYKRDLRRKLLKLRHLFKYQQRQVSNCNWLSQQLLINYVC